MSVQKLIDESAGWDTNVSHAAVTVLVSDLQALVDERNLLLELSRKVVLAFADVPT